MAENEVVCSTIRPTYRLSYDSVAELLLMHVEEEAELYLLAEVAKLRQEWRSAQVITLLDKFGGLLIWLGTQSWPYKCIMMWPLLCQREGK